VNRNTELPIRVLIVDKHEAVRRALGIRLDATNNLAVVGIAENLATASEKIRRLRPDVIVLGLHSSSGEEMNKMVLSIQTLPDSPAVIIVLAPYVDAVQRDQFMAAGAKRYLLKHINSQKLIQEIEAVANPATV
jgi:DNA-binding NarL/FixJ family response regulator